MKITKSKSTLKLKLQVVISEDNCPIPETVNFARMQSAGSTRVHKLTAEMPAPAKQAILANTKNKIQLNAMLVEGLLSSDYYNNVNSQASVFVLWAMALAYLCSLSTSITLSVDV